MRLSITIAIMGFATTPVLAQGGLEGDWQGYWIRAGDSLPVGLKVSRDTTGGYLAHFSSDRLRVSGIPFNEVRGDGCCDVSMTLRGDRSSIAFAGTLRGDSLTGTMQEGTLSGRFAYARVPAATAAFEEREVTFANGAVTLSGTLLLPQGGNAIAAVVFMHGSGPEGRWASRFLASQLASHGVAALIFDKRGVGRSTGDWRTASFEELADDAAAAVDFLRHERRIDPARIGLHGHSQGGTIAPLVAARASGVAFVVGSAAAGLPTDSTEIFSILNSIYPRATSADDSASASLYTSELVAVAYHGRPRARLDSMVTAFRERPWYFPPPPPGNSYWFFSPRFARFQALEWWPRVRVPVLLIYGADDQRVPAAASAERIAAALRGAGNADVTVKLYAGADHTFRLPPGPSGWPITAPGYVSDLLAWLARR